MKNDSQDQSKESHQAHEPSNSTQSKPANYIHKILSNVTIEPMLFLKMVAEGNFKIMADTLEIDRVCRINLNYSEKECQMMDDGNHTEVQNAVQIYQNVFNYHQNLIDSILPFLILLVIGPFSERYGRKLAMIIVLAGFIGLSLVYILTALNPSWPVEVLYLATLCVDLSGSWVVFNMAVYSYLADITTVKSRTKRMGFADAIWYFGSPVGTLLGGFVYKNFGYVSVYGVSCLLWVLCFFYTLFYIRETRRESELNNFQCGPFGFFASLIKTVFRKRPEKKRNHVITLICLKLGTFLVQGHQTYIWARKVLHWSPTTFSTWSSIEEASHQLGMVGWVWMGEYFAFHGCIIAIGGLFSIFLWSVTLAAITSSSLWWLTILASFLGLLEASIEPAIRSLLTAIVGLGEEGKILAVLGILEAAWLSVDRALYTYLYNVFIDVFPQINYVVQAGFAVILIIAFLLLKRSILKNNQQPEEQPNNTVEHSHES